MLPGEKLIINLKSFLKSSFPWMLNIYYKIRFIVRSFYILDARDHLKWKIASGDKDKHKNYNFNSSSIFFDVGGFTGEFTDKMMTEFYCTPHISGFKFGYIMNDILTHKKPRDHPLALGILRVAIEEFHKREETEVPDHYYNLIRGDLGLPLIEETFQPLPLFPDQSNPEQLSQMQMGIYLSKDQGFEFYKINEEIYEHIESDKARDEAFSAVIASISEYHMKGGPEGDMEEEVVYDELRKSIGLPRDKE